MLQCRFFQASQQSCGSLAACSQSARCAIFSASSYISSSSSIVVDVVGVAAAALSPVDLTQQVAIIGKVLQCFGADYVAA